MDNRQMNNRLTEYILKHSKKRDEELKYDFMPSLLEIIEKPAHKAGMVIIWGTLSLLVIAIIWAAFSKVDTVVTASGTLQPQGDVSIIKAYGSGQIKNVLATEGEYVKEGDLLMEFDGASILIEESALQIQQKQLLVQKDIYDRLQSSLQRSIQSGMSETQTSDMQISDLDIQINAEKYEEDLRPYVSGILESYTSYINSIKYMEKDIELQKINRDIAAVQLKQYEQSGNNSQAEYQKLAVQQYEIEVEKKEIELEDKKSSYAATISSKLAEINTKLGEVQTQISQAELVKDNQRVCAPVSGYVSKIAVSQSETVAAMQELISIVPSDKPMEIQCYVANRDIADINVGMEAEMKLEAYPYDENGTVKGRVKYISPGAFSKEQLGNVYLVRLEIVELPENITVISGLQGSIEMKTGKRSILQYFLEPITKGLGESMKEQ